MEHFLARQPILDLKQNIHAYELLFRSSLDNYFDTTVDQDQATSRVIANSFLLFGIEEMTHGAKAFINFTRGSLLEGYAAVLPREQVVVEVLESVRPDDEVVRACTALKDQGYTLALDDFVYAPKYEPLLAMADVVKVDFIQSNPTQRAVMAKKFLRHGITMLAEKVETQEEFEQAKDMGYTLFQGYFFTKPVVISRSEVPGSQLHYLRILQALNNPDVDYKELGRLVGGDVTLSYRLLRYINSPAFGLRTTVTSIEHALALLGVDELRKWAALVALSGMGQDKPQELVVNSVVRGRMAELLAPLCRFQGREQEMFMMGLFSLVDAIYGRPKEEMVGQLNLSEDIKRALVGADNKPGRLLALILAQERGHWQSVANAASALHVPEKAAQAAYIQAVRWHQGLFSEA